jgi:DNA-binding CsgD family transcriptional regulator
MKPRDKIIQPIRSDEFQASVNGEHLNIKLPAVDDYFENLIKHFNRFAIGRFCWLVADRIKGTTHSAGGATYNILGLQPSSITGSGPEIIFSRTHPEDLTKLFAYSEYWIRFLSDVNPEDRKNYVNCIFIRVKNERGKFAWVMLQYLDSYIDDQGNSLFIFTAITDVSHIKHSGETIMTIRDILNNSTICIRCQEEGKIEESSSIHKPITLREQEILRLIATGLGSKQVADKLGISINTINNHRQNLLRKTGSKSSAELISYGVTMGYLAL